MLSSEHETRLAQETPADLHTVGSGRFLTLALGSLGVVFGDIGTSPLYALKAALTTFKNVAPSEVIGLVSLIVWALLLTVTAKYVLFLMRADNKGEGGILSLNALARSASGRNAAVVFLLGVAGASLFAGDAVITPAISVLSALEGLKQINAGLSAYILPSTAIILIILFISQRRGTAGVAAAFGPIMLIFFVINTLLGVIEIPRAWIILQALTPFAGLQFLFTHGGLGFVALGSVFLAVTGAEALYADMGHFGAKPIQASWLFMVLPALVLNYLGQGALIIANPDAADDPYYHLAPAWLLPPLIVLATMATVIASQAVITGAFSLVSQAIQLGLLPRLEIVHTSDRQEGQIFIPRINRILLVCVLVVVSVFRTSDSLANAYGVSVAGTMVMTTALSYFVVRYIWKWTLQRSILLIGGFLIIDSVFFVSNLYKVWDGGYVPLLLGSLTFIVMWTWSRGSAILNEKTHRDSVPIVDVINMLERSKAVRVPGTAVFLTNDVSVAPSAFMHNLKHNKVVHERVIMMSVRTAPRPRVPLAHRYEVEHLSQGFIMVKLHYGYMEQPRVPVALAGLRKLGLKFDIMTTSFFLGRRTLKPSPKSELPTWQEHLFIGLAKQATSAPDFFHIPSDRVVELGAQMKV